MVFAATIEEALRQAGGEEMDKKAAQERLPHHLHSMQVRQMDGRDSPYTHI